MTIDQGRTTSYGIFNGFDGIYHHHLMKCAGTTLNRFLELQVHSPRAQPHLSVDDVLKIREKLPALMPDVRHYAMFDSTSIREAIHHDLLYRHVFDFYDITREHANLHPFAKGNIFTFTVLREPGERVLSQYRDWRRLNEVHFQQLEKGGRANVRAAAELDPYDFMEKFLGNPEFPEIDNFMVRSLASVTLGQSFACHPLHPAKSMLNYAARNLVNHFNLVFIQEDFEEGFNDLCEQLGLCPQGELGLAGNTRKTAETKVKIEARLQKLLRERLAPDYELYDVALDIYEQYRMARRGRYTLRDFEDRHAAKRLTALRSRRNGDAVLYDINEPFIGYGFWDRGSPGQDHCSIWSGPGLVSGLFSPAPKGERVKLVVFINAFTHPDLERGLQVQVDGRPRPFEIQRQEDGRFIVSIPHVPVRDFVHLRFEVPRNYDSTPGDPRPRGFLLWKYGWQARG